MHNDSQTRRPSYATDRRHGVTLAMLLVALTALTACGGDDGGAAVDGGPALDADLSAFTGPRCELSRTLCERQLACKVPITGQAEDLEACLVASRCNIDELPANVAVDAERTETCRAAVAAASCATLANMTYTSVDPACGDLVHGTASEGEACSNLLISECAAGLECGGDTCPGTCQVPPPPCIEGSCEDDAWCDTTLGRCTPRAALGETCHLSDLERTCVAGASCSYDTKTGTASCVDAAGPKEACSTTTIALDLCDEGYGCFDGTCAPLHTQGEGCQSAFDCIEGLYCRFGDDSTCQPRLAAGATCESDLGACQPGLVCEDGTCQTPSTTRPDLPIVAAGASCQGAICELGSVCRCPEGAAQCDAPTCAPLIADGQPCLAEVLRTGSVFVCERGLCDFALGSCVVPGATGATCGGGTATGQTLQCLSTVCLAGACAALDVGCGDLP